MTEIESRLDADAALLAEMRFDALLCAPMGRLAAPTYALGAIGLGLAVYAGVLMLGSASLAQAMLPIGGAWAAWAAAVSLKLWAWSGLAARAVAAEPAEPFAAALQPA
jgi:hypothetical protein